MAFKNRNQAWLSTLIVVVVVGSVFAGLSSLINAFNSAQDIDTALQTTTSPVGPTAAESASYDEAKSLVEKLAARGVFTKINERTLSVVVGTAFYSLDYESKKAACRAMAIVLGGDGALVVPFDLLDHYSNAKIGRYGLWGLKLY